MDAVKSKDAGLFLFEDEQQFNPNAATENLFKEMSAALDDGAWDGDRDSWPTRVQDTEWRALTVDRRQCTGRRCRFVNQCPFFKARNDLEESECIVANHDLVMADLSAWVEVPYCRRLKTVSIFLMKAIAWATPPFVTLAPSVKSIVP